MSNDQDYAFMAGADFHKKMDEILKEQEDRFTTHKVGDKTFHTKKWSPFNNKYPKTPIESTNLSPKELALEHICSRNGLNLARERLWAIDAIDKIGTSDFYVRPEYGGLQPLARLKMQLWEVKMDEYINVQRALFFKNDDLVATIKALSQVNQDKINVNIVAQMMTHGEDKSAFIGGIDPVSGSPYNAYPTQKDFDDLVSRLK